MDGPVLRGYRFHRQVSVTDFSEIWLAEDEGLRRAVAVKIFAPKPDAEGMISPFPVQEWRRRFFQEARLQAAFDHPNIVPVVGLETLEDGRPALVMQYMSGSLRLEIGSDLFAPGEAAAGAGPRPVPPARARAVLLEVLAALAAVHRRGIVHRDVKPHNLLLTNGPGSRVKLGDFGMAKPPGEVAPSSPVWFGTRDYISPEQYADASLASDRSDIFSLGVIGIRMVTGHFPDRRRLAAVAGLGADFAALLVRMLESRPENRPGAEEALARLVAMALPPAGVREHDGADELLAGAP